MDLEMVLNELSFQAPAPDIPTARKQMAILVNTIQAATKKGVKRILRTHQNFNDIDLAASYPLSRWRNDPEVEREIVSFLRTIALKHPYLASINDLQIIDKGYLSEFFYNQEKAEGLGIAFLLQSLAISLPSDTRWNSHHLVLTYERVDDNGELIVDEVEVNHASSREHVSQLAKWFNERIHETTQTKVHNGSDLWMYRDELFPHLQFCASVESQLQKILSGYAELHSIIKRLFEFEAYCKDWRDGSFDHQKLPSKITPESVTTLEMYKKEHTFRCPGGEYYLFSWHARLTPGAWRIYFYPEETTRQIIIGHIGHKLANKLYPT
jgi:hypothetical protein